MTNFDFAAAIKARPGGDTRAELVGAYGDPLANSTPTPAQRGWFTPPAYWEEANLVGIPTEDLPGFPLFGTVRVKKIKLHRTVAPVFRATWAELVRRGLNGKFRTYSGAYAPRHMGHDPNRAVSVHAYGAAIDFDAAWNGYGVPLERMQINRDVVEVFERMGWHWGGRWSDPYEDGMHFQWTDPLQGVRVADWQDAGPGQIIAPPVTTIPATPPSHPRRLLVNTGQGVWTDLSGRKLTITNADRVVINATGPDTWVRYLDKE